MTRELRNLLEAESQALRDADPQSLTPSRVERLHRSLRSLVAADDEAVRGSGEDAIAHLADVDLALVESVSEDLAVYAKRLGERAEWMLPVADFGVCDRDFFNFTGR